jgi:hypothetical protein
MSVGRPSILPYAKIPASGNSLCSESSISWSSYWTQRTPSSLIAVVFSSTQINLTWTDATKTADGLKIYISTDNSTFTLKGTASFGDQAFSATGLTTGNVYYFRLVAYKGANESTPITTSVTLSTLLTSLTAYWKFNESSGNAADVMGLYDLTNNNVATFGAGKNGNCGDLGAGNTNKSFSKDSVFGMTYASPRSCGGWFKLHSLPLAVSPFSLFGSIFATNPGNYSCIFYKNNQDSYYYFAIGGSEEFRITLELEKWYHVLLTWDHVGNVAKLYFNGDLVITDVSFASDYTAQTSRFSVGSFVNIWYPSAAFDEAGYWNKILTESEVNEYYNSSIGSFYPFQEIKDTYKLSGLLAYCWFNSVKAIYNASANKTWIGVVYNDTPQTGNGIAYSQHILTLNHTTLAVTKTKVGAINEMDDHNEGSILVRSSDNKLFTAFTEHAKAGSPIRTRVSTNALDATAWGAAVTIDPDNPNTYTYCNAFEVTNGDIYIFYRNTTEVLARWAFIKSTDGGANWSAQTIFSNATYHRIYQNDNNKNIIHFIGSAHPNEGLATNYVVHFYFNAGTGTWHKSDATDITATLPVDYADATAILTLTDPEQCWIEDLMLDSNGYPRVLLTHFPNIDTTFEKKDLYYSEWNGSTWNTPYKIHQSINRNIAIANVRGEISYPPLSSFDRGNINRIFACKEISDGGQTELYLLTRVTANSFTSVKQTASGYDQWRPFTTNAPIRNIFWLNKVRYYGYQLDYYEQLINKTI